MVEQRESSACAAIQTQRQGGSLGLVGPDLETRAVIDSCWGTLGCGVDESGADIASLLVPHLVLLA